MSMNGFFKAFPPEQLEAMLNDHALIDRWVWTQPCALITTDVESAWDVLSHLLDEAGFRLTAEVDNALSNGCYFISAPQVQAQAQELARWSEAQLLERLRQLDAEEELYHQELYSEDEDGEQSLVEQFEKLLAFYSAAAKQNLGVVYYLA